jgi:hypothetical protein
MPPINITSLYACQYEILFMERMAVYSWNYMRHIRTYRDPYAVGRKQFLNV